MRSHRQSIKTKQSSWSIPGKIRTIVTLLLSSMIPATSELGIEPWPQVQSQDQSTLFDCSFVRSQLRPQLTPAQSSDLQNDEITMCHVCPITNGNLLRSNIKQMEITILCGGGNPLNIPMRNKCTPSMSNLPATSLTCLDMERHSEILYEGQLVMTSAWK